MRMTSLWFLRNSPDQTDYLFTRITKTHHLQLYDGFLHCTSSEWTIFYPFLFATANHFLPVFLPTISAFPPVFICDLLLFPPTSISRLLQLLRQFGAAVDIKFLEDYAQVGPHSVFRHCQPGSDLIIMQPLGRQFGHLVFPGR